MVTGNRLYPDRRISNDFDAPSARTDPTCHSIAGFAYQPYMAGQIGGIQLVKIENNQGIVSGHVFFQTLFPVSGGNGDGRQLLLEGVRRFGISLIHTGADAVDCRSILSITDIIKGIDQVHIALTEFEIGKQSNFNHTVRFKIEDLFFTQAR